MKLQSMTDFVLQVDTERFADEVMNEVYNYASFLKQPLQLGMFVPCNLDGNVLQEPENYDAYLNNMNIQDFRYNILDCSTYQRAKERVLFDGFEYVEHRDYWFKISIRIDEFHQEMTLVTDETIEDLLTCMVDFDLDLTESAIKQLYGENNN